jgi:hypothetical protein
MPKYLVGGKASRIGRFPGQGAAVVTPGQPYDALVGISRMRRIFGLALFLASSSVAFTRTAGAQDAPSSVESGSCFGFSFGTWTPPLDWRASGHAGTPASVSSPLAPGGRDWAAASIHPDAEGTMLLFPSWWPVGVMVALPTPALALGDTVQGRATALVANGVTPSSTVVRAWRVACGTARDGSTAPASVGDTTARIRHDQMPIGTWRGRSTCLTAHNQCVSDSVVYRIAATSAAPDSVSLSANTVGMRGERPSGELLCRYDPLSAILSCDTPNGILRLAVRGPEMGGRLTRRDGVDLRYVHLRRDGPR